VLWSGGYVGRQQQRCRLPHPGFSIAHPNEAEGLTGRNLPFVGIGMVVASLLLFAVEITVAANALSNVIGSLEVVAAQR
jgi:hypothetical protein